MFDRIKEAITEWFGERCDHPLDDPEAKCDGCEAWKEFDRLVASWAELHGEGE